MKRFLSIILCFATLFSLAACSGGYKLDDKQIKQDVLTVNTQTGSTTRWKNSTLQSVLRIKSQIYFEKTGELFKVTETVNFEYYFDTATNTWQIKSADVIASTAEKLTDGFELTNTAMVDGVVYNVKLTGVNPDGTFTGTASDVAISETPLAGTRLCGANVVGRPQGKNQVWYFLVTEGKLSSIFTATGSLSPTVAE